MTPGARIAAAIDILDTILAGAPAEQALTGWARRSRFAGSKDRAAIRDHVFDALRRKRSFAARGGALTGRGLMLGALRAGGIDPAALFTGAGYAPAPPGPQDASGRDPAEGAEACDMPDWLWPRLVESLGARAVPVAEALQSRAPVHLRVNLARINRDAAARRLHAEGIETVPHAAADSALEITHGARRVRQSAAYADGLVELQDGASQAVAQALPLTAGMRVLDYCAGGGGKALAMAARADIDLFAHDIAPDRMRDLPARAARAGARVTLVPPDDVTGGFDLVLCDAPCSGSGAWRRDPDGKWRLTPARLTEVMQLQSGILRKAAGLVADKGVLAYATCSVLADENDSQVDRFLDDTPGWACPQRTRWLPDEGTDGFYLAQLTRA